MKNFKINVLKKKVEKEKEGYTYDQMRNFSNTMETIKTMKWKI